jgi:hypothetical protein
MKTLLTILLVFLSGILIAQNGINYKALIKDTNGNVAANQDIDIVFSIQHESVSLYSELQEIMTDNNGIAIATIGDGTPTIGIFDTIDWRLRDLELNVQIDLGDGLLDFGNSPFNAVPYAINTLKPQGLEAIDEGNGIGWRLSERNSDAYGAIGLNAIDLSISSSATDNHGAKGQNSFAAGFSNEASGAASTTLGLGNIASGNISTAFGNGTFASALNSTAFGVSTQATGNVSTAMGYQTVASGLSSTSSGNITIASGNSSTAMGYSTRASGDYTTAMGFNAIASSYASTAIGRFNIAGGFNTSWVDTDPLFEIGTGISIENRSNALTVLKNGNVGIGTHTPDEILHIEGRLKIGTETIEDTGSNQLSVDASLIPNTNNAFRLGNSSNRWIGVWATDGTINTSDRRDKTNIAEINYGLNEILKMNPVSFNWKHRKDEDKKLGLIAQDLLKLVPEVVKTHDWKNTSDDENAPLEKVELARLGVYYSDLIPVLINAIKEQQSIIDNEKTINAKQNLQLEALLSRIEDLEANNQSN